MTNTERTEKPYLTTTEFAEAINVHPQTVRYWDKNGVLPAHHKTPSGKRLYAKEQVDAYYNGEFQLK